MYEGKRVIIYGLGIEYQKNREYLEHFFCVVGYSDRNKSEQKKYVVPEKLKEIATVYDYIYITSFRYIFEIKNELMCKYEIPEEKIIWEVDIWKELMEVQLHQNYYSSDITFEVGNKHVSINRSDEKRYLPLYGYFTKDMMPHEGPEIYNVHGKKMDTYFIRDVRWVHRPYWSSKYFVWDRYNWGLNTHFYNHRAIFQTMGSPIRKYGMFTESKAIVPKDYELLFHNPEVVNEFDAFFTFDEEVLNRFSNARLVPFAAEPWYGRTKPGKEKIADNYKNKTRNISMIASHKDMCEGHRRRRIVAQQCKTKGLADTFGRFDGGLYLEAIEDALEGYRYSVVMENDITSYYFTEKLTSCFAAQTVPIYLGATKISEFFNTDGMIILSMNDLEHIEDILKQCNERDYESRLPAILDNYQRVQKYLNIWDNLYEDYILEQKNAK